MDVVNEAVEINGEQFDNSTEWYSRTVIQMMVSLIILQDSSQELWQEMKKFII